MSTEENWCHCNNCGRDTKHDLLFEKKIEDDEVFEGQFYCSWSDHYSLLECRGCEPITLKKVHTFSEAPEPDETFYPPRVSRRPPHWQMYLPFAYTPLIQEVYSALQSGNRILAMMGARALIDIFIRRRVGDQDSFVKGLDALVKQNYLSELNRRVIETAIEAGNAATHRDYNPSANEVNAVMDIVENLIQHDVLLQSAEKLSKAVPPRTRERPNNKDISK